MAFLPTEPFTVIGDELSSAENKSKEAESSFIPPSSTWYDESHQHFVALLDRSFMIGSTTVDSNEVSEYKSNTLSYYAKDFNAYSCKKCK